jgi:hypothetical protein
MFHTVAGAWDYGQQARTLYWSHPHQRDVVMCISYGPIPRVRPQAVREEGMSLYPNQPLRRFGPTCTEKSHIYSRMRATQQCTFSNYTH